MTAANRANSRVEPIGLGQDAVALANRRLERIDDGDREAGGVQAAVWTRCHLPVASRPPARPRTGQTAFEGRMPALVLGTRMAPARQDMDVEPAFADVDSYARLDRGSCSGSSLPCIRDVLPIICSGQEPKDGRTLLPCDATHPGDQRSHPSASGPVATGPDAPISLHQFGARNMQEANSAKPSG